MTSAASRSSSGPPEVLRIGIVGGSIGGLTAGVLLHELGHDVRIFERSTAALQDRGAGIVVLPITERYFSEKGGSVGKRDPDAGDVALTLTDFTYVDHSGSIIDSAATNDRFTSWNTLYRALLDAMPPEHYRLSHEAIAVEQTPDEVTVTFVDQEPYRCDLLIGADGIASTVRQAVSPGTTIDPSGYVAWRGTVLESDLPPATAEAFADAIIYQVLDHSHVLAYAIPGPDDSTIRGERALNFVWYRNVDGADFEALMTDRDGQRRPATMPPGYMEPRQVSGFRTHAEEVLAPQLADVVLGCDEPFVQVIFDMVADRFHSGRVVLLGDAAAVARPHVAAGTAKACADAWALRDHLAMGEDLHVSLEKWDRQQSDLARSVAARSRRMGEASQVSASMVPGDPDWRFGLY